MSRTIVALLFFVSVASNAWSAEPRSLASVPSDAAFFFGIHNQSDFVQRVSNSEFARLFSEMVGGEMAEAIPSIQEIAPMMPIMIEFGEEADGIDAGDQKPSDAELVIKQVLQSDAFIYGDFDWVTTFKTIKKISEKADAAKKALGDDYEPLEFFMSLPDEMVAKIRVPSTGLAFELDDPKPATRALNELHSYLQANPLPEWVVYRGKKSMGEQQMLVFSLRPWESGLLALNWQQQNVEETGAIEKLKRVFNDRELIVAVGVTASRLTFCLGESRATIERLVTTEETKAPALRDTDAFKTLLKNQSESVIATAYVSDDFVSSSLELKAPGALTWLGEFAIANSGMITTSGGDDEAAVMVKAMITSGIEKAGNRIKAIGERWDAIPRPKPAGWSMAVFADDDGISGRSIVRNVDPLLPKDGLDAHQFTSDAAIFQYSFQSTTIAERLLLVSDLGFALNDSMTDIVLMQASFEDSFPLAPEEMKEHQKRLAEMGKQLRKIVNEQFLPSLHNGGNSVVLSVVDPLPESAEENPFVLSILTRVSDREGIVVSGRAFRRWLNGVVKGYLDLAGEPSDANLIPSMKSTEQGESTVYEIAGDPEIDDEVTDGISLRLSDEVLVFSTNKDSSKELIQRKKVDWPSEPGVLRWIAELSFLRIAKVSQQSMNNEQEISDEDLQQGKALIKLLASIKHFRAESRTKEGLTSTTWRLPIPIHAREK